MSVTQPMGLQRMHDRSTAVVEVYEYPDSGRPLPNLWDDLPEVCAGSRSGTQVIANAPATKTACDNPGSATPTLPPAVDELKRSFEVGQEQGIREGRELERRANEARLFEIEQKRIAQAVELANQFAHERDRFLSSVEQDVVRLALAIAERVLRREAQMDPLFLVGAVRVALSQLAENMQVRLRVPNSESELWTETLSHLPNLKVRPEIVPDPAMQLGECIIESELGSVDIGLRAQLHSLQNALLDESPAQQRKSDRDIHSLEAHP